MILTHVAGVELRWVADRFGTPAFVYDRAKIEERIRDLSRFPVIRYAAKANPNLAILSLMRRNGVLVDAVSAGEIHRALRAGYEPGQIIYTSDVFDRHSLELVGRHAIHINCGSPDMIAQLGNRFPGRPITLRVNPGFGHGHSRKTNTGGEIPLPGPRKLSVFFTFFTMGREVCAGWAGRSPLLQLGNIL